MLDVHGAPCLEQTCLQLRHMVSLDLQAAWGRSCLAREGDIRAEPRQGCFRKGDSSGHGWPGAQAPGSGVSLLKPANSSKPVDLYFRALEIQKHTHVYMERAESVHFLCLCIERSNFRHTFICGCCMDTCTCVCSLCSVSWFSHQWRVFFSSLFTRSSIRVSVPLWCVWLCVHTCTCVSLTSYHHEP